MSSSAEGRGGRGDQEMKEVDIQEPRSYRSAGGGKEIFEDTMKINFANLKAVGKP
jgi:hypothetical protein